MVAASTDQGTGINHWWTYEERSIAGLGKAMVNVSNGNMLVQALDVDIPERGIDLAFQRTWNSQSQHDVNGDDGSDAAIFGNKWTNTFDAHLVYRPGTTNVISVYDIDGTRYDYTADGNGGWIPPSGIYDTLQPDATTGCDYWWAKKSGTSYYFHTPADSLGTSGTCGTPSSKVGRLYGIVGRNSHNNIQITYQYAAGNNETTPENIVGITATHSDGDALTMAFKQVGNNNELFSITMPNGIAKTTIYYKYDANGNLIEMFKASPAAVGSLPPDPYFPSAPIPVGYVPTVFNLAPTNWVSLCGPRGALAFFRAAAGQTPTETDGDCAVFSFDSTYKVSGWYDDAVMNFTPSTPNPLAPSVPAPVPTDPSGIPLQPVVPASKWITVNQAWLAGVGTGSTTFADSDGHERVWTYDSTGRTTQTQEWIGASASTALVTSATWGGPANVANATPLQLSRNNNILSETDAAGNATNYAYDPNGNTIEVALPPVAGVRPVQTYNYDYQAPARPTHPWDVAVSNNLIAACDAVHNTGQGFVNSVSDSLCSGNAGTTRMVYTPTTDEPFGELTSIQTPCVGDSCRSPGNTVTIAYSPGAEGCGAECGLPTSVTGTSSAQNSVTYAPQQSFVYNAQGALTQYNTGIGVWHIYYNSPYALNRPTSRTDPDGYTSVTSYNVDASVSETQTSYQVAEGVGVLYSYDANGDAVTETHYKGGTYAAGGTPTLAGPSTTAKFYDGLDRLVEVVQPNGGATDVYSTPWITRYIYDLSQPAAPTATGYPAPAVSGVTAAVNAYGNLYKTQEYLPTNPVVTWQGTQIAANSFQDINGAAFDGLDRPVTKYRYGYVASAETVLKEILRYDATPDSQGHLYSDAVSGGAKAQPTFSGCLQTSIECKTYTYDNDGRETKVAFTIDGTSDSNTPDRATTYDLNGRPLTVSSTVDSDTYIYDAEGREQKDTKADGAFFIYDYYPDGKRAALSTAISTNTFQYDYANDGSLLQQLFNMPNTGSGHVGSIVNTLTAAGRVMTRTDEADGGAGMVTTYHRSATGMVTAVDYPGGKNHTGLEYDADGNLLGQNGPGFQQVWTYNARGELVTSSGNQTTLPYSGPTTMYYADGVQVLSTTGVTASPGSQVLVSDLAATFDARMGAVIQSSYTGTRTSGTLPTATTYNTTNATYDAAGRSLGSGVTANSVSGGNTTDSGYATSRTYDVENHVTGSSGGGYPGPGTGAMTTTYTWGTNGHPVKIGSGVTSQTGADLVEWDGNSVLYTRNNGAVDDVKIGTLADITFADTGYNGVTFYDRGNDGSVAFCHNNTGSGGNGDGDPFVTRSKWGSSGANVCGPSAGIPPGATFKYPLQIEWAGSDTGTQNAGVGNGWILGETRGDGINDGVNTIQGVRAYDANTTQWTTPDAYGGEVSDPMSQKAYAWNGNNPASLSDPTGYWANLFFDPDTDEGQQPHSDLEDPAVRDSIKTLVDRHENNFANTDDAAYAAAYKYKDRASEMDKAGGESNSGVPEIGVAITGKDGSYKIGDLKYGYYAEGSGYPTIDIEQSSDLAGMWHAHPNGTGKGELFGHIDELTRNPWLRRIYTSIGPDLYRQFLQNNGAVVPDFNNIQPICRACI